MKAWLVTWEWMGDHAKRNDNDTVAAVLNPHWSGERVREFVEFLYLNESYALSERIAFAIRKSRNPYRAKFGQLDGHPWLCEIHCGHNPFLYARLVDDFTVERAADGKEKAVWKERPRPKIPASTLAALE